MTATWQDTLWEQENGAKWELEVKIYDVWFQMLLGLPFSDYFFFSCMLSKFLLGRVVWVNSLNIFTTWSHVPIFEKQTIYFMKIKASSVSYKWHYNLNFNLIIQFFCSWRKKAMYKKKHFFNSLIVNKKANIIFQ